jgi:hypothetical protein
MLQVFIENSTIDLCQKATPLLAIHAGRKTFRVCGTSKPVHLKQGVKGRVVPFGHVPHYRLVNVRVTCVLIVITDRQKRGDTRGVQRLDPLFLRQQTELVGGVLPQSTKTKTVRSVLRKVARRNHHLYIVRFLV